MKLCRFGLQGHELPAILENSTRFDVSAFAGDYTEDFFQSNGVSLLRNWFDKNKDRCPMVDESVRWAPCVARPSKIICVGLNYADHAAESKMAIPEEPILFFKATTSLAGAFDELIIPKNGFKTDWEVELAVVIGKKAAYIEETKALEYVAGYCLHNDYSERAFQLERGGQWVKGKSCDSFAPMGPWMATADEFDAINNLRLWLSVNEKIYQEGNTNNLIFSIPYLVAYISQFMTLLPGDIISTGTPAGVGMGQKPSPVYIQPGDTVSLGIDGLGVATQHARQYQ